MIFDAVLLSRLQFAWVVGWHVILPAFMIGIASYIAVLEGLRLSTGRDVYLRAARIWEWRTLGGSRDAAPFAVGIVLFLLSYLSLAISMWPMVVPYRFTLWEAASPPSMQAFLLVGTLFMLPVILMYSGWSYWVFREKSDAISATSNDRTKERAMVKLNVNGQTKASARVLR